MPEQQPPSSAQRTASQPPPAIVNISSPQNQRYKSWLRLLDGRGIKKQEEAIISGKKFLQEITAQHPERIQGIIVSSLDESAVLSVSHQAPIYLVPPPLFAALDIYGTKAPLVLISAPPLPVWDGTLREGVTLFLPFQNPINLGTTIRTAAAFHIPVVLLQEAASPYLPKSLRASGPAILQTPIMQGPSLQTLAEYSHLPLYALDIAGENIFTFVFPGTLGLVAGMEGPGVGPEWQQKRCLSIPMQPEVESLNAAIAVSMALACKLCQ